MEQAIVILVLLSACSATRVSIPHRSDSSAIEVGYPQPISLDRFEAMLQRANQMLRSPTQVDEHIVDPNEGDYSARNQEPNYYLPVYQTEKNQKLDAKSRQMQFMVPPSEDNQESNFYIIKQKKLPKKFKNSAKQINVKVVNDGERGELPSERPRGYSNEHNIVFDDTFFGVDAQVAVPDEVPQEHSTNHGFIAPIYSRRNRKAEDLFATQTSRREARMKVGMPMARFSFIY